MPPAADGVITIANGNTYQPHANVIEASVQGSPVGTGTLDTQGFSLTVQVNSRGAAPAPITVNMINLNTATPFATILYNGLNSTIATATYGNVTISGSGTATAASGTITVEGNLSIPVGTLAATTTVTFQGSQNSSFDLG